MYNKQFNKYKEFVLQVLDKMNICKTEQLEKCLLKVFEELPDWKAFSVLYDMQSQGYCVMTKDGYCMTRGTYCSITDDKFCDSFKESSEYLYSGDFEVELDEYPLAKQLKQRIECFWIVVDYMPDSLDFVVSNLPFNLTFTANNKLYEVIYIPKENEDALCQLIVLSSKFKSDHFKEGMRRIAVIEDEKHAWKVPHLGFRYVVKVANNQIEVLEDREENRWSDDTKQIL